MDGNVVVAQDGRHEVQVIAACQTKVPEELFLVEPATDEIPTPVVSNLNRAHSDGIKRHKVDVVDEKVRVVGGDRAVLTPGQLGDVPVGLEIGLDHLDVQVFEGLTKHI